MNVRVIRDPRTHEGKGFGYVFFKEIEGFKAGLKRSGSKLLDREVRVKKAVPAERLEKKQVKKQEKAISINKDFAMKRLQSKLQGKAVVHDKNEEAEEEQ